MSKRVLVAEDSKIMRRVIVRIVSEAGYQVVGEAENGLQAVEMFRSAKPDVMTLDLTMPGLHGLEALRRIRASDPQSRVLVVSSLDQKILVDDVLAAGASGFVKKPFQPDELVDSLDVMFEESRT